MGKTMGITKRLNLQNIFIFLFLIVFPFGQIIRIGIIHPVDVVVGLAAIYTIFNKLEKPEVFKYFNNFIVVAIFSWIFSLFIFREVAVLYGLLYLLRLVAYFYFLIYVWNFASNKINRDLLVNSLLSLSLISALFGWIQYFWVPDMKPFFTFGWDEHLFRLVGTFLDPTFLGLIIVFGILISIFKKKWLFVFFLIISLAFTYSRASYLALFSGLIVSGFYQKNIKNVLFILFGLGVLIAILPTSKNPTIQLFRSFSAIARVDNYKETLTVFKKSPIFGIGYSNVCMARNKFIALESFSSHACSGSDSSLLLILATTGVVGLVSFFYLIFKIRSFLKSDSQFPILYSCFLALMVHSIFSNSLFYPWIMGYMVILLGVSLRTKSKN